jgi:hypothetical protein
MRPRSTPIQRLHALVGAATGFLLWTLPGVALAGNCPVLSDCERGNLVRAVVSVVGAAVTTGLAAMVGLDGGYTANGDGVDLTDGGEGGSNADSFDGGGSNTIA